MFCKNIEPQIVLINKNNLRTFEPQECQKYKNIEPQQNLSGSYKKEKVYIYIIHLSLIFHKTNVNTPDK